MTAQIIPFPRERLIVRVERERSSGGWLVLTYKGHAWLHGSLHTALDDAENIAAGFDAAVRVA